MVVLHPLSVPRAERELDNLVEIAPINKDSHYAYTFSRCRCWEIMYIVYTPLSVSMEGRETKLGGSLSASKS
jgi:hypothetical protein